MASFSERATRSTSIQRVGPEVEVERGVELEQPGGLGDGFQSLEQEPLGGAAGLIVVVGRFPMPRFRTADRFGDRASREHHAFTRPAIQRLISSGRTRYPIPKQRLGARDRRLRQVVVESACSTSRISAAARLGRRQLGQQPRESLAVRPDPGRPETEPGPAGTPGEPARPRP